MMSPLAAAAGSNDTVVNSTTAQKLVCDGKIKIRLIQNLKY